MFIVFFNVCQFYAKVGDRIVGYSKYIRANFKNVVDDE